MGRSKWINKNQKTDNQMMDATAAKKNIKLPASDAIIGVFVNLAVVKIMLSGKYGLDP